MQHVAVDQIVPAKPECPCVCRRPLWTNVLIRHVVTRGKILSQTLFILLIIIPGLSKWLHSAMYADDMLLWCKDEYVTPVTHIMLLVLDKMVRNH
ncbi:hypothetical protein DPMN_047167 [Dreissena polymorpha]|uniref:Uncharacterized protein n=1 Tax=Dreissena polymorpha TaxID=45954 RepID=A0A9D4D798_DREPO|nr:hypothetical protein DPMN_047167 [Dreissena polymorpha]